MLLRKEIEENMNDIENSSIFDKFSTKQKISFKTLQQAITSPMDVYNSSIKMITVFILSCMGLTFGYFLTLLNLGAFNITPFLTVFFALSIFGFFYGSANILGNFVSSKKIFKFQKEDIEAKNLFEKFLNADTDNMIAEVKEDFFHKLDKLEIKQSNPAVYDHINHNISILDGKFSKLKYDIEQSIERDKYTFEPFRDFFSEVEYIETCLQGAKDIKVINE